MFCHVISAAVLGADGYPIRVEADVSDGLPGFTMVGYLSSEVKEAQERVRTAVKNSGFPIPPKRITINLSPANIRKAGTGFDLPIAAAVLSALGIIPDVYLKDSLFAGELSLGGQVKEIYGGLVYGAAAREAGLKRCFVPEKNAEETSLIDGIDVIGVSSLGQLVRMLRGEEDMTVTKCPAAFDSQDDTYDVDFRDVSGQLFLRRATEVAVSGMHNILFIGPAGSGKSMIAERIPTIMPPLTREEDLEISKLYSVCGILPGKGRLLGKRPFRAPHHSISLQALVGGGKLPKPGELSLASKGVLFLDELPEFSRATLETLRQPLERREVTISRVYGSFSFVADGMLAAAMNPCPCGHHPDRRRCSCSDGQVARYLNLSN